jgi:DNA-binding MarR family transcriptional regulator
MPAERKASGAGLRGGVAQRRRRASGPVAVPDGPESGTDSDLQRILRHWREAVPNDRFAHLVKDTTRALVRALQRRLAEHDVSFGHWAFLRILWETDGLTQTELSKVAGVMAPTTFVALKAMETRGFIRRRQLAGNRRRVHIFLTAKGRALKRTLVPLAGEVNDRALDGVPAADVAVTRRALLTVLANLARIEMQSAYDSEKPGRRRDRGRELQDEIV